MTVKRAMDLFGSMVGLAFTGPLLLPACIAVRVTLGPPVMFRQVRPGLHGNPFTLYKLRTMRSGDQSLGDEARLTLLGRALRATSIDELPSLWNVLRGDMSLVGPRPLLMSYLQRYTPEQARRHEVKPGITGLAQIKGRNALTWEAKFTLDVWYVDHQSLLLDLKILIATVWKVVRCSGIGHGKTATMPEFMGERDA
jgi:lipopolysaccharide/colanic/teichoic acid biosynthesis glycosyltransferase